MTDKVKINYANSPAESVSAGDFKFTLAASGKNIIVTAQGMPYAGTGKTVVHGPELLAALTKLLDGKTCTC